MNIDIRKQTFPIRLALNDFVERYSPLIQSNTKDSKQVKTISNKR